MTDTYQPPVIRITGNDERFDRWFQEMQAITVCPTKAQEQMTQLFLSFRKAVLRSFVHPETKMKTPEPPQSEIKHRLAMAMDLAFAKREAGWTTMRICDEIGDLLIEALGGKDTPIRRAGAWGKD
jgi:hypothetical protein